MRAVPYLNFDGQCAEAFGLYERVLGGKAELLYMSDTPMAGEMGSEWEGRVMHARLESGDLLLMASDSPPGRHQPAQAMWVSLHVGSTGEAERIFAALSEGGTVTMPLEKTFWSERFGMLVDRYGIPWMVNTAPDA